MLVGMRASYCQNRGAHAGRASCCQTRGPQNVAAGDGPTLKKRQPAEADVGASAGVVVALLLLVVCQPPPHSSDSAAPRSADGGPVAPR